MTQPVQAIVPDTKRYRSLEAETALVYSTRDHDYHDPIMCMVRSALEESWEVLRTDLYRNLMQNPET